MLILMPLGEFPISVASLCRLSPFIASWLPNVWRQMRQVHDSPAFWLAARRAWLKLSTS